MDVGTFVRSKTRLTLWLVTPVALILAVHFGAQVCRDRAQRRLVESRTLMRAMPQMERRLKDAREVVGRFAVLAHGRAEATELVRRRISQAGQDSGFLVNTLSVDQGLQPRTRGPMTATMAREMSDTGGETQSVVVTVGGDATLEGLIRFLDALQAPESLIVFDSAFIRTLPLVSQPLYSADVTLRYHLITL